MAVGLAIRANNAVGIFSAAGGGMTPGSGQTQFDDFNWAMARGANSATKTAALAAHGWNGIKDSATTGSADAGGFWWTATPGEVNSHFGVTMPAFPNGSPRCMICEALPSGASWFDSNFNRRQTDFYLTHPTWPNDVWFQYCVCLCWGTPVRGDKELYPSFNVLGGTPWAPYIYLEGTMVGENGNPAISSGQRAEYEAGTRPSPRNQLVSDIIPSLANQGVYTTLVNSNAVGGGDRVVMLNQPGLAFAYRQAMRFYLVKLNINMANSPGRYRKWQAPFDPVTGQLASALQLVQDSNAPGISWPIESSITIGATTFNPRTSPMSLKWGTTKDWFLAEPLIGDHAKAYCFTEWGTAENQLSVWTPQ